LFGSASRDHARREEVARAMRVKRNELPSIGCDETEDWAGPRMRQNGSPS
jgi:hypothetical protein